MKLATHFAACSMLTTLLLATQTASAVPSTTSFTARISQDGAPVSGSVTLVLTIYDAATGGTTQWTETHTVAANSGLVYAEMGSTTALDSSVFDGSDRWLEVSVNNVTQSPRLKIGSVPYAVAAGTAAKLGNLGPGDVAPVNHTHDASQITGGTLNNARFSAYSDLDAEGRLDNNSSSDLLTRSQADARYISAQNIVYKYTPYVTSLPPSAYEDSDSVSGAMFCALQGVQVMGGGHCELYHDNVNNIWWLRAFGGGVNSKVRCGMRCLMLP